MSTRSRRSPAAAIVRALPLLALAAACSDGPTTPPPDLDPLGAAMLASDTLGAFAGRFGTSIAVGPVPVAPVMPTGGTISIIGSGCAYSATSGRVECAPVTMNGVTFECSFAFFDRDGRAQERFDPLTTDRIESRTRIVGSTSFPLRAPDGTEVGTAAITVDRRGEQTTSGLLDPSGRRRLDGTAAGTESHVVTTTRGTMRAQREFADTTSNLVITVPTGPMVPGTYAPRAPLSGRIVRVSHAVETPPTGAPRTVDMRVVTEFLEGGTARTTITINGTTHVCTQNLLTPLVRPTCS